MRLKSWSVELLITITHRHISRVQVPEMLSSGSAIFCSPEAFVVSQQGNYPSKYSRWWGPTGAARLQVPHGGTSSNEGRENRLFTSGIENCRLWNVPGARGTLGWGTRLIAKEGCLSAINSCAFRRPRGDRAVPCFSNKKAVKATRVGFPPSFIRVDPALLSHALPQFITRQQLAY